MFKPKPRVGNLDTRVSLDTDPEGTANSPFAVETAVVQASSSRLQSREPMAESVQTKVAHLEPSMGCAGPLKGMEEASLGSDCGRV